MKLMLTLSLCALVVLTGCASNENLTPEERRIQNELKKDAEGQFRTPDSQREIERLERSVR